MEQLKQPKDEQKVKVVKLDITPEDQDKLADFSFYNSIKPYTQNTLKNKLVKKSNNYSIVEDLSEVLENKPKIYSNNSMKYENMDNSMVNIKPPLLKKNNLEPLLEKTVNLETPLLKKINLEPLLEKTVNMETPLVKKVHVEPLLEKTVNMENPLLKKINLEPRLEKKVNLELPVEVDEENMDLDDIELDDIELDAYPLDTQAYIEDTVEFPLIRC